MLNVKTLTDTLSRMELPQLQQYASLHKNDPYVVSLALSIANQKKQMKAEQTSQTGMQPQPKVVDQQIAQISAPPQQTPAPQQAPAPQHAAQQMPSVDPMGNVTGYADGGYLPEDTGIGQLPAPNMQGMAEGGIVAFEDGGKVPGFAGPTGSYIDPLAEYLKQMGISTQEFLAKSGVEQQQIRAAANAAVPPTASAPPPAAPPPAAPPANTIKAPPLLTEKPSVGTLLGRSMAKGLPAAQVASDLFFTSDADIQRLKQNEKNPAQRTADAQTILNENPEDYAARKVAELEAKGGKKLSPDARNMAMSQFVKDKIAGQVKRGEAGFTKSGDLAAPANIYDGTKAFGTTPPPGKSPLSALQAGQNVPSAEDDYTAGINKLLKSSQAASSMGPITKLDAQRYSFTPAELADVKPEDFAKALDSAMPKNPTASLFDTQQQELNRANVEARQNAKAAMEKQFKEQGLAFESTLNKLTAKEKRVQTMEDNQLGMSLLEAGLAMMAGESPHALVNIGKGAQVGTKKYADIQDKVEAYRDKIDETKMKIEEYRRNEANMNARELRAAQKDIDDSVSAGAQSMIALAREQYGLNRQQAISFVSNSMQMQQFNVNQKNQAAMHNQSTAAGIDTAYAQMANAKSIADAQNRTHLGLAALEAKYRQQNPAAGSLGFYKQLGGGDAVKGMKLYSENLGPEGKGSEALLLDWQKKSPIEKNMARKADPIGSAQLDRLLQQRVIQGSISDAPAGTVLDK